MECDFGDGIEQLLLDVGDRPGDELQFVHSPENRVRLEQWALERGWELPKGAVGIPTPMVGLVVWFEYVWKHETQDGYGFRDKRRPAMIIAVSKPTAKKQRVMLVPQTAKMPDSAGSWEWVMPGDVARLGFSVGKRAALITDHVNVADWPPRNMIERVRGWPETAVFGFMSPEVVRSVEVGVKLSRAEGRLRIVDVDLHLEEARQLALRTRDELRAASRVKARNAAEPDVDS